MSTSLAQLDVLVLDCQSTGASPAHGRLLEVAWCRADASSPSDGGVESHLVALPCGERVPRRITALTGIGDEDLSEAPQPADVWERLTAAAAGGGGPAVAHFARFERAFLTQLHEEHGAGPFPFEWICTHEIAQRALPGLPRRGLRAVSGYFGRVMEEAKRAADHVRATRDVWRDLVRLLGEEHGVTTLDELQAWTAATPPARRGGREYAVARDVRLRLRDVPGVYRMLGRRGQVLYVGKATSLRKRVNSYFQKRRHASERTPEMLAQVFDVETTETGSALEAALREADSIKRHAPPYNVSLRGRSGDVEFLATDLSGTASSVSALYRDGPVPGGAGIGAWPALHALLCGAADDDATWRAALVLPEEVPLDPGVARDGLALFAASCPVPSRRAFLALGARSWRALQQRRAEERAAREDDDPADAPSAEADGETDEFDVEPGVEREPWAPREPGQIASLCESSVRHGAHLLRRARLLRWLAESTIVWRTGRADAASWRRLVVEGAEVVAAADVAPGTEPPVPRFWRRGRDERAATFDVAAYDRLRVLTTELRRLVAVEREVALRLAPRVLLDRDALARRLYWI